MHLDDLQALVGCPCWARDRLLDAVERLSFMDLVTFHRERAVSNLSA